MISPSAPACSARSEAGASRKTIGFRWTNCSCETGLIPSRSRQRIRTRCSRSPGSSLTGRWSCWHKALTGSPCGPPGPHPSSVTSTSRSPRNCAVRWSFMWTGSGPAFSIVTVCSSQPWVEDRRFVVETRSGPRPVADRWTVGVPPAISASGGLVTTRSGDESTWVTAIPSAITTAADAAATSSREPRRTLRCLRRRRSTPASTASTSSIGVTLRSSAVLMASSTDMVGLLLEGAHRGEPESQSLSGPVKLGLDGSGRDAERRRHVGRLPCRAGSGGPRSPVAVAAGVGAPR